MLGTQNGSMGLLDQPGSCFPGRLIDLLTWLTTTLLILLLLNFEAVSFGGTILKFGPLFCGNVGGGLFAKINMEQWQAIEIK